jgi:hypothetical protein
MSADVSGYGRAKTQSLPPNTPLADLLTRMLTDFLERNTYRGFDSAIADTIEALS